MKTDGLAPTARQPILWLPLFMSAVEYLLRLAFEQSGGETLFPISLAASAISLNVSVLSLPGELLETRMRLQPAHQLGEAQFIATMGNFAFLCGLLLWFYLLIAGFSEEVRRLLPFHPLTEASLYYFLSIALATRKAQVMKCWIS